jgi:hypothetical protein
LNAIKTFFKRLFCSHEDIHSDDYNLVCNDCGELVDSDDYKDDDQYEYEDDEED